MGASYDEFGVVRDMDLKEGGKDIEVTDANKHEFIKLKMQWRLLDRVAAQRDAVRRGFFEVMPEAEFKSIKMDDRELELILCGIPEVDIKDWRTNSEYKSGYSASDPVIEGFAALKGSSGPKMFCVQKVQWDLTRLPQAATCFNTLYLPPYNTEDQLKEKLEFAVTEASEGFGLK